MYNLNSHNLITHNTSRLSLSLSLSMEKAAEDPTSLTTFQSREGMTQKKLDLGNACNESLTSLRRARRPETHRRSTRRKRKEAKVSKEVICSDGSEDDEKAEVERKIMALQRIVPGGESLGIENLFEETAGYIKALQAQVRAMRVIASFFEGLECEKRKLGG
ncbi:transcription factor PAR1-like [Rhododendron vialii]|uniref:transcription factor PAR1-like n=1 Tax=Rhododendron vialii TaxID=182163 RepID=UPI00265F40BB|nr:transcription factor PAR1-like [Rhododendron vialii]